MLVAALCFQTTRAASKSNWPAVTPEELAETKPKIEPEAAVEALLMTWEVDDRNFPIERRVTLYQRFKIYDPEKAEAITRMSEADYSGDDDRGTFQARLTLPNGTSREFGKDSIKERALARKGQESGLFGWLTNSDFEVKEKFLAITGVEAGAVLEYRITRRIYSPGRIGLYSLQDSYPIRQATFFCRICPATEDWDCRTFALNTQGGKLTEDTKKLTVSFSASNLRSILREPFVGPATDNAATIVWSYSPYKMWLLPRSGRVPVPDEVSPALGPWAPYSTLMNWAGRDRGDLTAKVKQLAAETTQGLTEPEAKARAIHAKVQALSQRHRFRPGPRPKERVEPDSIDDVIDVEKRPEVIRNSDEFVYVALALYRAAGLDAQLVLLPDRQIFRFNPQFVSPAFLSDKAVAIRLGDRWRFSAPQTDARMPFGLLPWEHEAQLGLLALDHKQEFIKVPGTPADRSVITSTGRFSLDAEGTLTGDCSRAFTGQTAVDLRAALRKDDKVKRDEIVSAKFGLDPKVVEVKVTHIDGIREAEKPLVIAATIRWPGFATRTKERLLVRPAVFRVDTKPPFTASERRHPVHFPYRWEESDRVDIHLPEGFEPEAPTAPPPSLGEALSQETKLSYDRPARTLRLVRSFTSNVLDLAPEYYPTIKAWYDRVAQTDQHEIIFSRKKETPAADPAK
jgi:hypothetical protein